VFQVANKFAYVRDRNRNQLP